ASAPASAARRQFNLRRYTMGHSTSAPATAVLLCDDLLFTSRISGTARSLGLSVRSASTMENLLALTQERPPACIILDLSNPTLQITDFFERMRQTSSPMPKIIAYGSHVDAATLRAAREAGCDLVLPRSKFVEELPRSLPEWLAAKS